ncbi:MAG: AarF/ABC1/UbiB kinase family protein [Thermodesulfobacteriota bacterium]
MRHLKLHLAYKSVKRLRDIVASLVRHGFYPLMESLHLTPLISIPQRLMRWRAGREKEELSLAVRTRLVFEELGPTFIKFGQILSTRPDIAPGEFIDELLKLQDEVPPYPYEEVVSIVEDEFKRPVGEIFSKIEREPVAAASIAQVHGAVTTAGDEVVIKVQRPGIEETISTDIAILSFIARRMVRYLPESRVYDPVGAIEEFAMTITREMDFTLEASHMERFRKKFSDDPRVVVPKVFWDYTGKKVLTMERVSGIKVDRVEELGKSGIDTRKVARLLTDVFFRQVFEFGYFHGDLHPGNIFVQADDRLALVDFGIVGRIEPRMQTGLADLLICSVKEDFEGLTKTYLGMGVLPEEVDEAAFKREYWDVTLHYFGRPLSHVRLGDLFQDYIRIAARHGIRVPRDLLLFDKCLIELEGLTRLLHPDVNIMEECEPYAARLVKERVSPGTVVKEGVSTLGEYGELAGNLPEYTSRIMKKLMADRLAIEFVHRGLEEFIGEVDRSSNRVTFGIIMAAMVIGSSLIIAADAGPMMWGYPALGIFGFLLAGALGLWLAFLILKSGKF